MRVVEGPLQRLAIEAGDPVCYTLAVGGAVGGGSDGAATGDQMALNPVLCTGLEIRFLHALSCRFCDSATAKSYGGGYCYPCFKRLARCDLCVMSPDRCHYHHGTCREPEWGEAFCMQPHIVYLANSSGPKVGITRDGRQIGRWLDQGACQGVPILATSTRQIAGIAEVNLAGYLPDRTDWRRLVAGDAEPVDLLALRDELKREMTTLPDGAHWLDEQPVSLVYPVARYGHRLKRLRLDEEPVISGNLMGIKGQFLLFEHGVFNVSQHASYHVRVTATGEPLAASVGGSDQMELFK
jgi:hypothetical protein